MAAWCEELINEDERMLSAQRRVEEEVKDTLQDQERVRFEQPRENLGWTSASKTLIHMFMYVVYT